MKIQLYISFVLLQMFLIINLLHSNNSIDNAEEKEYNVFTCFDENSGKNYQALTDSFRIIPPEKSGFEVGPSSLFITLNPDASTTRKITITNRSTDNLNFLIENIETSKRIKAKQVIKESISDSPDDLLNFIKFQIENGSNKARNISWLEKNISTAILSPDESVEVEFSFSSVNLPQDVYNAIILVGSNNSAFDEIMLPVTMVVTTSNCPYLISEDNENNALQGIPDWDLDYYLGNDDPIEPIEFNFFIDEDNITSVILNIYAFDVDETGVSPSGNPEINEVYLNGNYVGILTGADDVWSSTSFTIEPGFLNIGPNGKNLVQIYVSVLDSYWMVEVDWGQLIINNCQGGDAYIRTVDIDKTVYLPGDAITITSETDTELDSQTVLVETNLLDDNLYNVDGITNTLTIYDTQDEPLQVNFAIPPDAILGTEYTAQVIVYDATTYLFQDIETLPVPIGNMSVEVSPDSIFVSLCEGESLIQIVTISNTGDGDINFTLNSPSTWLSESPSAGTILPGNVANIQVTINSAGSLPGYSYDQITITTNVPANPEIDLPITMEVLTPMVSYSTVNTGDNENNELTGTPDNDLNTYLCKGNDLLPIEFNFFINNHAIESADLVIETFDVDTAGGFGLPFNEVDKVYFNGTYIGDLSGEHNGTCFTTIPVPKNLINTGFNSKNLVQIYVSVLGKYWCTNLQSAELRIYNCNNK